ncbi:MULTISPECIES: alpha-1,2-fucosyltransferase [Microbacterium]|uniref:alpha-1,2-fucosyltransferase n=1 Tax=Microbacterium TaxID=33882 RepID=UPI00217E1E15|nr:MULTISPECIES: alpha-1,2-fucosyltransferase [Microbacterium]UWF77892.1 alpha-1,2-fucosyltransferase [Microbacterium neungamense]WCM56069.1 alpha-1,2-fucosyltransferase [Microbacterium sp. EF45047]
MPTTPALATRVVRHLAWRARRMRIAMVDLLRRGDRTVILTPPAGLRFGNWLYLWLDAHQETALGRPTFVREVPGMAEWFDVFPRLRELTVSEPEMRFHDRRVWEPKGFRQRFGIDYSREALHAFARDVLAPSIPPGPPDRLVINVRRGDYYSTAQKREAYGFDQVGYVRAALALLDDVDDVLVVSDDDVWCRENVDAVIRDRTSRVEYARPDPAANFLAVAGARRIIGMNSTFTYWAAYVADATHDATEIIMPRFHARLGGSSAADQLDPSWTALDGFA